MTQTFIPTGNIAPPERAARQRLHERRDLVRYAIVLLSLVVHPVGAQPPASVSCADADLSKLNTFVYVSVTGVDSNNCGQSSASACKTIQQGITNCKTGGCNVLVRYGVYDSVANTVQLADGISLYGSCTFDGSNRRYRSTLIGRPAITATGMNKPTIVNGFVIFGASGASPGDASVAVNVANSSGLVLSYDVLASGAGEAGEHGSTAGGGSGGTGRSPVVNRGGAGGDSCPAAPPTGPTGKGGNGADFQQLFSSGCFIFCKCENNNYPASLGKNGENSGDVPGGIGGARGAPGCFCQGGRTAGNGPRGGDGGPGACGKQGGSANTNTRGAFAGTVWQGNRGGNGAAGQVGSGGGGGGSGGFGVHFPPTTDYHGYAGGGGGGGGCGGTGGTGGQQGGASVPLVVLNSSLAGLTNHTVIIPGPGGRGGNGGSGGQGGAGGAGANGRKDRQWFLSNGSCTGTVPGLGGPGGRGGQGGAGSGGAGGNGGPSFAVATVNSQLTVGTTTTIYPAQPGLGGAAGSGGQNVSSQCKGADGQSGAPGFFDNQNSIVSFPSTVRREREEGER